MTQDARHDEDAPERVATLVPGLDKILRGGFLRGGLYMVQGPPGMGKTILASQIAYRWAAGGSRALIVTVLGENHGRMMMHLRQLSFFDFSLIPEQVTYISAYHALEEEGLKGVAALISREIRTRKAALLVVDGASAVEAKAEGVFELKRFTHELETLASSMGCTTILLTTGSSSELGPERTMVDGLIELKHRHYGMRAERRLVVHKLRGSDFLEGEHAFRITREGVAVFPRIEAIYATPTVRHPPSRKRLSSGVASLDPVLGGGVPEGAMTAVVGPSGAGKTSCGLQFLAASNAAEPGLLFGCFEPPERLLLKAEALGLDLGAAEQRSDVEMLWNPVGEYILDELAQRLLDAVRRRRVKRLVIDGLTGFLQAALEPERLVRFWSCLSNELRALGVTSLNILELPELMGAEIRVPLGGVSALAEVMVVMRYVELQSHLVRLISLFKVRDGPFDPTIREFAITDAGIIVGKRFEGVEAVLSGMARKAAAERRTPATSGGRRKSGAPADQTG